jgi:phosphatidate phosphatase APP1
MGSVYRRFPLDKLSESFNLQKTYTQSLSDSVANVPLVPTVADKIHIKFTGQTDDDSGK